MKTVTRADLVEAAHRAAREGAAAPIGYRDCADLTGQVFEAIEAALVGGEAVRLVNFGSFVPIQAPPRMGCNPKRPQERHAIPAHVRVSFRAAAELKDQVAHPLRRAR